MCPQRQGSASETLRDRDVTARLRSLNVLGTIRIEAGRVVADVNSARRADRLKREISKRLSRTAALINTAV